MNSRREVAGPRLTVAQSIEHLGTLGLNITLPDLWIAMKQDEIQYDITEDGSLRIALSEIEHFAAVRQPDVKIVSQVRRIVESN
jgi:hypothetical protein